MSSGISRWREAWYRVEDAERRRCERFVFNAFLIGIMLPPTLLYIWMRFGRGEPATAVFADGSLYLLATLTVLAADSEAAASLALNRRAGHAGVEALRSFRTVLAMVCAFAWVVALDHRWAFFEASRKHFVEGDLGRVAFDFQSRMTFYGGAATLFFAFVVAIGSLLHAIGVVAARAPSVRKGGEAF